MNLSLLTVLCHGKNNSQLKELLKNNKINRFDYKIWDCGSTLYQVKY